MQPVADRKLFGCLIQIVTDSDKRTRLEDHSGGKGTILLGLLRAESLTATQKDKVLVNEESNAHILAGVRGELTLASFNDYFRTFNKLQLYLPIAARASDDTTIQMIHAIVFKDPGVNTIFELKFANAPHMQIDATVSTVREVLRSRMVAQEIHDIHSPSKRSNPSGQSALSAISAAARTIEEFESIRQRDGGLSDLHHAALADAKSVVAGPDPKKNQRGPKKEKKEWKKMQKTGDKAKSAGSKVEVPRDPDGRVTAWIQGMPPCNCGANHLFRDCPTRGAKPHTATLAAAGCFGCDPNVLGNDVLLTGFNFGDNSGEEPRIHEVHEAMVFTHASATESPIVDALGQRDAPLTYPWSYSTGIQSCVRTFDTASCHPMIVNSHWSVSEGEHAGVYRGCWSDVSALVADREIGVAMPFLHEIDALQHARLTIELPGYNLTDHRMPIVTTHVPTGDQMHIESSEIVTSRSALVLASIPAQDAIPIPSPLEADSIVAPTPAEVDIPPEIPTQVANLVGALGVAPEATLTRPGVLIDLGIEPFAAESLTARPRVTLDLGVESSDEESESPPPSPPPSPPAWSPPRLANLLPLRPRRGR